MKRLSTALGNKGARSAPACGASCCRHLSSSAPKLQTWALQTYRPWMCLKAECRKVNYARATMCEGCGGEKPNLFGWMCVQCETRNHKGIKNCKSCKTPYEKSQEYWVCSSCTKNNKIDFIDDNSICGFCEYDMAPKTRSEDEAIKIQQEVSERIREQQLAYDTAPVDPDHEDREAGMGTGWGGAAEVPPVPATPPQPQSMFGGTGDTSSAFGSAPATTNAWGEVPAADPWAPPAVNAWDNAGGGYSAQPQAGYGAQPQAGYGAQPQAGYSAQPQAGYGAQAAAATPAYGGYPPQAPPVASPDGSTPTPDVTATPIPTTPEPPVKPVKKYEYKPYVYEQPATAVSRLMKGPKIAVPSVPSTIGAPGFDWMCREKTCGAPNKGNVDKCGTCSVKVTPADWGCDTCGARNHWSRGICFNCCTPITPSWLCLRCRTRTSIYDEACRNCSSERPPVEPVDPAQLRTNHGRGVGTARKKGIDWLCQGCRQQNFAWRDTCFSCNMAKDPMAGMGGAMGAGGSVFDAMDVDGSPVATVNDNNWLCSSCHASNFRTRTECWQCGKSTCGGGAAASGGAPTPNFEKEGFQSDAAPSAASPLNTWNTKDPNDWTCGRCFAKNFKNRGECHKCGGAKVVAMPSRATSSKAPVKI